MAVWGHLTNSSEKKRHERQRRKGKIYPFECRVPKNSKESKKPFLGDQCKEIEENNRMGQTRDLFKKISDTKGTFHAKIGAIKDRNGMDLTEAEDIKKRWQEYTEELYRKDHHDPDSHKWCDHSPTARHPGIWSQVGLTREKAMAPHSSVLAWRIPGTGEPGGLPSMGSHRVGHDWSNLAAAAAAGLRRRRWHPIPVVLPRKSHGRRSLLGCSPWGR